MSETFGLEIYASNKLAYAGRAQKLIIPAVDGEQGFLAHHANVVAAIIPGEMRFEDADGNEYVFAVSSGFVEMINNRAKLFCLSPKAAVQKLAEDFGINPRPPTEVHIPKRHAEPCPDSERLCICVLRDYLRLLRIWRVRYEPVEPGAPMDDSFVKSCQMEATINCCYCRSRTWY